MMNLGGRKLFGDWLLRLEAIPNGKGAQELLV